jgi:hypothetical protein
VTPTGGLVADVTIPTDAFGAKRVIAFAREHAPGRRVWAIEGTGSYGSGLTTYLLEQGEWVVEIDRPARPARRNGAKSDELDAVRAAREALNASTWPARRVRRRGDPGPPVHPRGRRPHPDTGDRPSPRARRQRARGDPQPAPEAHDRRAPRALCPTPDGTQPVGRAPGDDHGAALDRSPGTRLRGRGRRS